MNQSHDQLPLLRIEPARRWEWFNLREVWSYRELWFFLVWRDIKVRYKQTLLGAAWAIVQPTFLAIVFTWAFGSQSESLSLPYPVFVFIGLAIWTSFASAVNSAANSLIDSERLVTKVYFPRVLIPWAALGPSLVDLGCTALVGCGLLVYFGSVPARSSPLALLGIAVIYLTALGIGTLLAALNVRYRDFRYTLTFLLQAGMFSTPAIFLPRDNFAAGSIWAKWWLLLNPLEASIHFCRAAIEGSELPWQNLAFAAAVAILFCLTGLLYFRRVEDSFADVI